MNTHLSRRSLAMLVSGGALVASGGLRASSRAVAQSNGIVSGGIGLTRTEFEQYFGPGEATQSYAQYLDPTYGGPIYAGYDFVNFNDGMLNFLELQWSMTTQAGGLDVETAANEVATLLPADAVYRRQFWMGATPGGPVSLRSEVWSSASLAAIRGGRDAILVTYQQKTGQLNPGSGMDMIVTTASIAVEG